MSRKAWVYIWGALITGVLFCGLAVAIYDWQEPNWILLLALIVPATVAQLFEAEHGRQSYYPHFVFFFAALVLLQPALLVLVIVVPHLIEWAKARLTNSAHLRNWYIQPFNIASHIVPAICAHWVYDVVNTNALGASGLTPVLSAAAAIVTYIGLNHLMIGQVLVIARGISWKQSGVLGVDSFLPDLIMSMLGYIVAVLWTINPWLTLPAISPLVLMYQALLVPQLKQDAQTDSKTGLWNAGHFATLYKAEMERAERFTRPIALIMGDLDLLRNINNTYGHIAGDRVLTEIGRILKETVREYDIPCRFGGEEFAIALPETTREEACVLAERIRRAVQETKLSVATSTTPIQVTMSMGVAAFPADALDSTNLIHEADIAVYQAKLNGRNCVVSRADLPHSLKLGEAPVADRLESPFTEAFAARPSGMPGSLNEPDQVENRQAPPNVTAVHAEQPNDERATPTAFPPPTGAEDHLTSTLATLTVSPGSLEDETVFRRLIPGAEPTSHPVTSPEVVPTPIVRSTPVAATIPMPVASSLPLQPRHRQSPGDEEPIRHAEAEAVRPDVKPLSQRLLALFVGSVIILSLLSVALDLVLRVSAGTFVYSELDLTIMVVLIMFAAVAEYFQITLYGSDTLSVSMAMNFAAALIAGVPGVAIVSLTIALVHYLRRKPALYKTAFNWSTHLLAGLAPVLILAMPPSDQYIQKIPFLLFAVIASAAVYFFIDTGLVATAIGLAAGENPYEIWKERFEWLGGHYVALSVMGLILAIAYFTTGPVSIIAFVVPIAMMRFTQKQYVDRTESSVRELQRMNKELTLANHEVVAASHRMRELNDELFLVLSKIIDARDPYVGGHAAKVSDYAVAIARELGMEQERIESLRQAGFLHDIGKIAISEEVLHKPARLTEKEYEYVKTHAQIGGEFLNTCRGLRHLTPFVRHHHERWDGKGYPDSLVADQTPLEARILAVCDAAEAMASDRPYRQGIPIDEVMNEIQRCAGTQFDPRVAAAFLKIVEREREHLITNSALDIVRHHTDVPQLVPST